MKQELITELTILADNISQDDPESADAIRNLIEECTHFECDCVPNLGPAHCHGCSTKAGSPVEWVNRGCNTGNELDEFDQYIPADEQKQMIQACVDALTPMLANSTQAWNLWNHIASDKKHIRYALQTIWALPAQKVEPNSVQPPGGWHIFGSHIDYKGRIEFSESVSEEGLPLWERPVFVPAKQSLPEATLDVLDTAIQQAVTEAVQDTNNPEHVAKAAIAAYRSALTQQTKMEEE